MTEWVKAKNGDIPRKAVAGGLGYGDIGAETMYVCRAVADDGSIVPGKVRIEIEHDPNWIDSSCIHKILQVLVFIT